MITFIEATPKKMPGISSIFISFDYNADIIAALKNLPNYSYDPKTRYWEIPVSCLSKALEYLNIYDDISLYLMPNELEKPINIKLGKYKVKPFEHQLEAIKYGLTHDNFLLLDAPGTGKTLTMTYLAQELKEKEGLKHCLVICAVNTLKLNWKAEIQNTSDLTCKILGERISKKGIYKIGSVKDRIEDLKNPIDEFFVITNIETIRNDDIVKAILNGPNKFDMIVVDEVHRCLDYDTIITTNQGELKLGDIVEHKIQCNVLSNNNGIIEYKAITDFHKYTTDKIIKLTFLDEVTNEIQELKCTPDHLIYTKNRGYVKAIDLTDQDDIVFNKN